MNVLESVAALGHEQLSVFQEPAAGYMGIVAIHSSVLGPAVGGTRFMSYPSLDDALLDALRLSRGMTYKNAAAGLPLGGGKAVIVGDNKRSDRARIFRAHGRIVDGFGGRFITGEDIGTSGSDMEHILSQTRYVGGIGDGGGPSPFTARGVFRAIQASAKERWGSDLLAGKTVALQGCGHVGLELARLLAASGVRLVVSDVEPERAGAAVRDLGATAVEPSAIYDERADVFAPCALGAVLNDQTIPRLNVEIVAGAANNQLLEERHGRMIEERGILYAPDFIANAGGVISSASDLLGWDGPRITLRVDAIYDTLASVFELARREQVPTYLAANRVAEARLRAAERSDHAPRRDPSAAPIS